MIKKQYIILKSTIIMRSLTNSLPKSIRKMIGKRKPG